MQRLLPGIAMVFVLSSLAIFSLGDSGVREWGNLSRYRSSLEANVEALRQRNASLEAELVSLRDDPARTVELARSIGLYQPGEAAVKLEGRPAPTRSYAVGDMLRLRKTPDTRNAMVKTIAAALCFLFAGYALLSARASRRRANGSQRG
jgi:cell division protein FtsB